MSVLVTGGAGYIGAHIVRLLSMGGSDVVAVDDLSTGSAARVGDAELVRLDLTDPDAPELLAAVMRRSGVEAVIHLAAKKQVGESVERPAWYFQQNIVGLSAVIDACVRAGVDRLVYSSSAAVYGPTDQDLVDESVVPRPINPYGETKLAGEWLLRDAARAHGLRTLSLRYFNVAGAGWTDLGDPEALNLVTIVMDRLRRGEPALVFGDDFPTPDGSGIRDYVHVLDLARAHLASIDYLARDERAFDVVNVGTGVGSSVFEIIAEVARAAGRSVPYTVTDRRVGDPARVVADPARIRAELGWTPELGLVEMIGSAWAARPQ